GRDGELLLHLVELGLAHHLVDMAAEFRGHAAHLRHPFAPGAQQAGQLLRTDDDQRHDRNQQQLGTVNTEHRRSASPASNRRPLRQTLAALSWWTWLPGGVVVAWAEIGLAVSPGCPACAGGGSSCAPTPFLKAERPLPK